MKKPLDNNLLLFRKRIKQKLGGNLIKIILFGSRARGEGDKYSDYDCLLLLKRSNAAVKTAILDVEGWMLYETNAVFSAFPMTKKEMKLRKYEPFFINATKEGVVI
jgi:predicted nucleotidyltransferase